MIKDLQGKIRNINSEDELNKVQTLLCVASFRHLPCVASCNIISHHTFIMKLFLGYTLKIQKKLCTFAVCSVEYHHYQRDIRLIH